MITVGWVQFNSFTHLFLPYSIGVLQSYIQGNAPHPERYRFLTPLFQRCGVTEAVAQLRGADIVGFSTYIWNIQRSLAIAAMLKLASPQTWIVFGGPQVPDQAGEFLKQYPFIDVCVHGPGEAIFLQLLETYPHHDWQSIPGISYVATDGGIITNPKPPRLADLNMIPSPYLTGVFDGLLAQYPRQPWYASWETNRGCPFACAFCDWGSSIQSKVLRFDMDRIHREIEWFAQHRLATVFGCDANFGILPRDIEIAEYMAWVKRQTGYPLQVAIQGTKNATERAFKVYHILYQAGLNTEVTLSLQSMNPEVLRHARRENISLDTYLELQHRFSRVGISTYTDMILGLPGETYDSFADGLAMMIEHGQHSRIKFYHATILPNAEMAKPEYRERHQLETILTNITTPDEEPDGICEVQEIVVATATMTREDLIQMRIYAWLSGYLYFGKKMLQIPFVLLHQAGGISYRALLEAFMAEDLTAWPLLQRMKVICQGKTRFLRRDSGKSLLQVDDEDILDGSAEMQLPLMLCRENQVDVFYSEALALLAERFLSLAPALNLRALAEALAFNQVLFKLTFLEQNPHVKPIFAYEQHHLAFQYNIPEFYQAVVQGQPIALQQKSSVYYKNWLDAPYALKKATTKGADSTGVKEKSMFAL